MLLICTQSWPVNTFHLSHISSLSQTHSSAACHKDRSTARQPARTGHLPMLPGKSSARPSHRNVLSDDVPHTGTSPPDQIVLQSVNKNEPVHETTNILGFRPGPTQTRLYSPSIKLEA